MEGTNSRRTYSRSPALKSWHVLKLVHDPQLASQKIIPSKAQKDAEMLKLTAALSDPGSKKSGRAWREPAEVYKRIPWASIKFFK